MYLLGKMVGIINMHIFIEIDSGNVSSICLKNTSRPVATPTVYDLVVCFWQNKSAKPLPTISSFMVLP